MSWGQFVVVKYCEDTEYTIHNFDPANDTVIDSASIPFFYKKGGDSSLLYFEDESDGEYKEYPFNMPEGHSTEDLVRIVRKQYTHDSDFRTNFDSVLLVFKNGDVYMASWWDRSVRGSDPVKLEVLCELSDHIVDVFFNVYNNLYVLMDDNVIYRVSY